MLADLRGGHVGARRLSRGRKIDGAHRNAQRFQAIGNVAKLPALGVERSGDDRGAGRSARQRELRRLFELVLGRSLYDSRRRGRGDRGAPPVRQLGHRPKGAGPPRGGLAIRTVPLDLIDCGQSLLSLRGVRRADRIFVGVTANAEQAPLKIAVGGQRLRLHDPVDAPVDHDRDRSETVVATPMFCSMTRMAISSSAASETSNCSTWPTITGARPSVGSSMISSFGIAQQGARRSPTSAARRRKAASRRCCGVRPARKGLINPFDRPGRVATRSCRQAQMLVDRQAWPTPAPLRDVADPEPVDLVRREARNLASLDAHDPRARTFQADDRVAQRRLAHAVAAEDRQHTALERQGDALERVALAIVDVKIVDPRAPPCQGVSHAGLRDRFPGPPDPARSPAARLP